MEGRVVGALVEKELATPQYYPLTLPALLAACNQSSNREPVTAYGEDQVLDAIATLKQEHLVRAVLPARGRSAVRYRHVLAEALGLDAPQLAVLCVLVLRGPQTVAELRARTERLAEVESVDHELELLAGASEPLVGRAGRLPGQKEDRWAALLSEHPSEGSDQVEPRPAPGPDGGAPTPGLAGLRDEVAELRDDLAGLCEEVAELRAALSELRTSLGG